MKTLRPLSLYERILILRRQLSEAFERGDLSEALALSRQMDEIQLLFWACA